LSPWWAPFCASGNYFACLHLRSAYTRVKVISRRKSSIRIFIHYNIYKFYALKKYSFKPNLNHWNEPNRYIPYFLDTIFHLFNPSQKYLNFNIHLLCMIEIKPLQPIHDVVWSIFWLRFADLTKIILCAICHIY